MIRLQWWGLLPMAAIVTSLLLAQSTLALPGDQFLKIIADDGARADFFGASVALDSGLALVGADQDDDSGNLSGSAYVFDALTGEQLHKLIPDDGAARARFGFSDAIDSGIALVGAFGDRENGHESGSAYVFDAVTGIQLLKLTPDVGESTDFFGQSVALDGGLALIGARGDNNGHGGDSGAAYLFDTVTGDQLLRLIADDGAYGDGFGVSVALDGDLVMVGTRGNDGVDNRFSGAAYIFNASTGEQLHKLTPNDGAAQDNFGVSVAVKDGLALLGADFDDENGTRAGAAYLFDAVTGEQLLKLTPDDAAAGDEFGVSVALEGGFALVGARAANGNGTDSGAAYLFDTMSGEQLLKLTPDDGAAQDNFGISVALMDSLALVGARFDDDNGFNSGSAYLFLVPEPSTALLCGMLAAATLLCHRVAPIMP